MLVDFRNKHPSSWFFAYRHKEIPHSATFELAVERKLTQFKHEIKNKT